MILFVELVSIKICFRKLRLQFGVISVCKQSLVRQSLFFIFSNHTAPLTLQYLIFTNMHVYKSFNRVGVFSQNNIPKTAFRLQFTSVNYTPFPPVFSVARMVNLKCHLIYYINNNWIVVLLELLANYNSGRSTACTLKHLSN